MELGFVIDSIGYLSHTSAMASSGEENLRKAAEARILAKYDRLRAELLENKAEQERLSVREREIDREIIECRAAAKFFEIDISLPSDAGSPITAARMRHYELKARVAMSRGESAEALLWHRKASELIRRVDNNDGLLKITARVDGGNAPSVPVTSADTLSPKPPKVADVILDQLRSAGDTGQRAALLQNYIENTYSMKLHEKTVGMTLYRLLKDNLVHRKGRVWFFGPQDGLPPGVSPEDPGVAAPGITHETLDRKGDQNHAAHGP